MNTKEELDNFEKNINRLSRAAVNENQLNEKSTINHENLEHFNNLVDIWWKGNGLAMLSAMNQVRIPFIKECLTKLELCKPKTNDPLAGLNILDVGCGGGYLSEALAELGANVTGLDASTELINCAKIHASENEEILNNIHYVCDTIENFCQINKEKYDVLVCSEVVEHVENVEWFLKCCTETIKPNGSLIITTINKTTRSWLVAIILFEYVLGVIRRGTHEWKKFVTPEHLREILSECSCTNYHIQGAYYNWLTGNWSFTSDTSGFYLLHAIKKM